MKKDFKITNRTATKHSRKFYDEAKLNCYRHLRLQEVTPFWRASVMK